MLKNNAPVIAVLLLTAILSGSCGQPAEPAAGPVITSLREVPAVRLNYRYEPDVPAPTEAVRPSLEERNAGVQAHFDQSRPQEILDRTIPSPDGKRILAVYHIPSDLQAEFRLDMYAADGALLRKVTPDSMAVHFPDTIVWSPDSTSVAFVAMTRGISNVAPTPTPPDGEAIVPKPSKPTAYDANINANVPDDADPEANANSDLPPAVATPPPPANVLTFRTEQIYVCNADGDGVKPLTQNEGLIYFYYVWSPDSSMLAGLAATGREWQYLEFQANDAKEQFVPVGRPRVIEKNGRERRLDDGLTPVQPVWSPDSAKIACAFDKQVRIYDAAGDAPTQAAVPLRNSLLLSSQAYDQAQQSSLNVADANGEAANTGRASNSNTNAAAANSGSAPTALPDEKTLVSFNPIVSLRWLSEDQLYFQTAYVKRMRNDAESRTSFPRWHRLILTPQPSVLNK